MKEDQELNFVGKFSESYSNNPVIKALVQLIPYGVGGALHELASARAQEIKDKRMRVFFDELASAVLSESLIQNDDFLHALFSALKASINTRRQEKIKLFARLLLNLAGRDISKDSDEFEDMLKILDELSHREMQILLTLEHYEAMYPSDGDRPDLILPEYWNAFVQNACELLKIDKQELEGMLARLSRSGCYVDLTGTYFDYEHGQGQLTPLYYRLKAWVRANEAA